MRYTNSSRPQIFVDLGAHGNYAFNGHLINVYPKYLSSYPFCIQKPSKDESFDITGFQIKNHLELAVKREIVSMVTFYDRENKYKLINPEPEKPQVTFRVDVETAGSAGKGLSETEEFYEQESTPGDNKPFIRTPTGMVTALAGGSVGGAAVGGSIIYAISLLLIHFNNTQ